MCIEKGEALFLVPEMEKGARRWKWNNEKEMKRITDFFRWTLQWKQNIGVQSQFMPSL